MSRRTSEQLPDGTWVIEDIPELLTDEERAALVDKIRQGHEIYKALQAYGGIPSPSTEDADVHHWRALEDLWASIAYLEQMLEDDDKERIVQQHRTIEEDSVLVVFSMKVDIGWGDEIGKRLLQYAAGEHQSVISQMLQEGGFCYMPSADLAAQLSDIANELFEQSNNG